MAPEDILTTGEILEAFAGAGHRLPIEALHQAVEHWPEHAPTFLALLQDAIDGAEIIDRSADILFFVIFLMAQQRETCAFAPLCELARHSDRIETVLGDSITDHLQYILVRLYDSDTKPLRTLIECTEADEFVRAAAIGALASLTLSDAISLAETETYLETLFTSQDKTASYLWVEWQDAIVTLGLDHLTPLVKAAFDHEMIDEMFMSYDNFLEDLNAASDAENRASQVQRLHEKLAELDDVALLFSTWPYFSPDHDRMSEPRYPLTDMFGRDRDDEIGYMPPQDPIRNPLRNVGRNDPCPCGSGKKFKKCCLGKN